MTESPFVNLPVPMGANSHVQTLLNLFSQDVHIVTEWKDGCVYRTRNIGTIVAFHDQAPFKPGSHASLAVHTR